MNGIIENGSMEADVIDAQQYNVLNPNVQPNKRKRKKSEVWQYFTPQPISEDCTRACCKTCNRSFAYIDGKKHSGTSHLRRHIISGSCAKKVNQGMGQLFPSTLSSQYGVTKAPPSKQCRATPQSVTVALDQERSVDELARMIVRHEYPINMVEQPGFIDFARALQPGFSTVSVNSVQSEIVTIYRREKLSLVNVLAEIPGRVSLTLDIWSTDQNVGYVMLAGHFVDCDWKLQRRVLNFLMVPSLDSEFAFNNAIVTCLSEWKLDNKLFALTIDQSFANEAVVGNIRGLLSKNNPHINSGQFLLDHCYASVISHLAQEALSSMRVAVGKVRDSVKFVKSLESREGKFNKLREQLQVPCTKSLVFDNQGKWDSTYHMLSVACELKEVFSCLDTSDDNYNFAPVMDDWKCIEALCACLKLLVDSTDILLAKSYPGAHTFFQEVYKIQLELAHRAAFSDNPIVRDLVRPLSEKFDVYWRDCCVVLAMVVVMDPRYKLKVVLFNLGKLYGEDEGYKWEGTINECLHDLYFEYVAQTLPLPSIHMEQRYDGFIKAEPLEDEVSQPSDGLSDFDVYISEISSNNQLKSELDQYLDEDLLPRDELDVIDWWKFNRLRYPTLSKMAADLLSIPFITVHRDSVFDTSRKLDSYRCCLRPRTLEAIVCTNDWLQFGTHQSSSWLDMFSPSIVKKEEKL